MIRRRAAWLRTQIGRPFAAFAALDAESRTSVVGLALVSAGFAGVGPGAFVPGLLLAAVGLRGALPIANPLVASVAIAAAAAVTVVGLVLR